MVAAARLALSFAVMPVGEALSVDAGAYLLNRDAWLGIQHDTSLQPRPPLAPGPILAAFTSPFGDIAGLKLFAIFGSLLTVGSSYYLSRAMLTEKQSLAVAALVGVDLWLTEAMVAAPLVLYGWALLAVALRPLLDWSLGVQCKPRIALMASALALLPFVNQTFAALCVLVFTVTLPTALAVRYKVYGFGGSGWLCSGLAAGGSVALYALPLYYLPVAPGSDVVTYGDGGIQLGFLSNPLRYATATAVASIIAIWLFVKIRAPGTTVLLAGFVLCAALMPFDWTDEALWNLSFRANYLASMFAIPLAVIAGCRIGMGRKMAVSSVVAVGAVGVLLLSFLVVMTQGQHSLSKDAQSGYAWLETQPPGGVVVRSWGESKIVAALTNRKTIESLHFESMGTGVPNYIEDSGNAARCILEPTEVNCRERTVEDAIGKHEVSYVMVVSHQWDNEKTYQLYSKFDALPYTRLVWQRGEVRIWELDREAAREFDIAAPR